jgi:UDP-N-acetylglucosamine 2-epimerase (non-hydrolysing)
MSKNKINIHLIAAARPNFMKIAPLYHALKSEERVEPVIVHTGQHYDLNMSDVFFEDLRLPAPDIHLGVGSGSHAEQAGQVMMAYEKILIEKKPDLVIVVGDVNSTMAATLAAVKINYGPTGAQKTADHELSAVSDALGRPLVAHLEAGLRSFDRTMPEEINRLVTDALTDILWTPSADADENLIREGLSKEKIHRVGNMMIDSLEMLRDKIQKQAAYNDFGLKPQQYGLVTLHRPSNVDEPEKLKRLCKTLIQISKKTPLAFPIHPRTRKNAAAIGILPELNNARHLLILDPLNYVRFMNLDPLNYVRFMNLVFNCRFALTDSGGIQEETTYLGIPCVTLRPNTERPITVSHGTNRLSTLDDLEETVDGMLTEKMRPECNIPLWDGKTAGRVVNSIRDFFINRR